MTIHIENLRFSCIIGILDFERITPQDIILDIKIDYHYNNEFINYADAKDLCKSLMLTNKFLLIEDALPSLSQNLKKKFSSIEVLYLKITKPSILPDCTVSVSNTYSFNS